MCSSDLAPLVDGRAAVADVIEIGMTGKEAIKLGDHEAFPGWPATREGVILDQSQGCAKLPMPAWTSAKNCGAGETHFPSGKMLIKKMIHCNVALLGGSASMVSCALLARCRSGRWPQDFLFLLCARQERTIRLAGAERAWFAAGNAQMGYLMASALWCARLWLQCSRRGVASFAPGPQFSAARPCA